MNIGKYTSLKELTFSATAQRLNIPNAPSTEHINNLIDIVKNIYDPLRYKLNNVRITSGYRSTELNKLIGGAKNSQHCKGEALDLNTQGTISIYTNANIFNFIKDNLDFDQLIWEFGNNKNPDWVHCSFSLNNNRKSILKASKLNDVTIYRKWEDIK